MAKIFIFIFSGFLFLLSGKEISPDIKKKIIDLEKSNDHKNLIIVLEKSVIYSESDINLKLKLARLYLYRNDLSSPRLEDDIFVRNEKFEKLRENLQKASTLLGYVRKEIESRTPNSTELSKLYFQEATAEFYLKNYLKSETLFKKAMRLDPKLKQITSHNIGLIQLERNLEKQGIISLEGSIE
ncbi:MAG: hypothetical protein SFU98_19575 [Leptospiraceae bacterium]|nr:hypothetical protein [Leptospiraceae bacterium]